MLNIATQANPLDIAKLLDIYNAQTTVINALWNFFIIVTLGIIGYVYKDSEIRKDWKVKIGFSIGFIIFALGNITALRRALSISIAASDALAQLEGTVATQVVPVLRAYTNTTLGRLTTFHVILDLLVLLAMWLPNIVVQRQNIKDKTE